MFKTENLRIGLLILSIIALSSGCKKKETGPAGPDTTPPRVISVESTGMVFVEVTFSERIDSTSALDLSNYMIVGLSISGAELDKNHKIVKLFTFTQDTSNFEITVKNVQDLSGNVMNPQTLTFTGWYWGIVVQANVLRVTHYWSHIEEASVWFMEDGRWDDYATVLVDGTRLYTYMEALYKVGMTLESGKSYDLFLKTSKGNVVTGSVEMTYPVEFLAPISGDTIPEGQSLQIMWEYGESPPESLILFYGSSFSYIPFDPIYRVNLEGNQTNHTIPGSAFYHSPKPRFLTLMTINNGNLKGARKGSYFRAYDINQVTLYIKE
jgi:hypothetical protein